MFCTIFVPRCTRSYLWNLKKTSKKFFFSRTNSIFVASIQFFFLPQPDLPFLLSMKLVLMCVFQNCRQKKGHVGGKKLQKIAIFHKYVLVALRQISNQEMGSELIMRKKKEKCFCTLQKISYVFSLQMGFHEKKDRILLV